MLASVTLNAILAVVCAICTGISVANWGIKKANSKNLVLSGIGTIAFLAATWCFFALIAVEVIEKNRSMPTTPTLNYPGLRHAAPSTTQPTILEYTTIAQLNEHPEIYAGKMVQVAGDVKGGARNEILDLVDNDGKVISWTTGWADFDNISAYMKKHEAYPTLLVKGMVSYRTVNGKNEVLIFAKSFDICQSKEESEKQAREEMKKANATAK